MTQAFMKILIHNYMKCNNKMNFNNHNKFTNYNNNKINKIIKINNIISIIITKNQFRNYLLSLQRKFLMKYK